MALVLDGSRVTGLEDKLGHDVDLFNKHLKLIVLQLVDWISLVVMNLQFASSCSISHLLLLNLGELDLLEHLLLGEVSVLVLLVGAHEGHLALLLTSHGLVHLEELALVLGEKSIDIFLVHVAEDLLLLFGELLSHHLFLLLSELLHDLVLVTLDLVFPVEHAVLPVHEFLHLAFLLDFNVVNQLVLLFVSLLAE